jgi:acyl-CoA synthetase (AMP-forming)/AMP-acid ligase II
MLQVSTFQHMLLEADARFGSKPFLFGDSALGTVSYSQVFHFAQGLNAQFETLGIPVGGAVATLFHNSGIAALLFLATIAARRLLVPLNPLSTAYELQYALEQAQCRAVLTDCASPDLANRNSIRIAEARAYFDLRCAQGNAVSTRSDGSGKGNPLVGEIVFTSGSTGRPKGVVLSEQSLLADAAALARVYDLRDTDRFLTVCPLFHNSGQVFTTLACALVGGSSIAVKSDVGMLNFWSYVEEYRPQWSLGMTSFLALLLSSKGAPKQRTSLRALLTGGSAIDGNMVERFEARFGVPVRTVYGLTESASIAACEFLDPSPRSIGSSGRPLPGCQVRIDAVPLESVGSTARARPAKGEILIAGETLFEGYVGDPEATARRKRAGWLRTGDLGYFDPQGNLFVVDRLDSMLIVGGENVYPAEVETLCSLLPGAAQIVLVGIGHPIWGNELVLVYRTLPDATPSIALWHRILNDKLSAARVPQRYIHLSDLNLTDFPRKENGKLDRTALVALLRPLEHAGGLAAERLDGHR